MKYSQIGVLVFSAVLVTGSMGWGNPNEEEMALDVLMTIDAEQFYAQASGDQRPGQRRIDRDRRTVNEQERQRRRKHLEQFRLLKLLELLDLDEDQELPFMTAFRAMRRNQRELESHRRELLRELTVRIEKPDAPPEEIYKLAEELVRSEEDISQLRRRFLEDTRQLLAPHQFGKLIVFQQRFDAELLEAARVLRRERGERRR